MKRVTAKCMVSYRRLRENRVNLLGQGGLLQDRIGSSNVSEWVKARFGKKIAKCIGISWTEYGVYSSWIHFKDGRWELDFWEEWRFNLSDFPDDGKSEETFYDAYIAEYVERLSVEIKKRHWEEAHIAFFTKEAVFVKGNIPPLVNLTEGELAGLMRFSNPDELEGKRIKTAWRGEGENIALAAMDGELFDRFADLCQKAGIFFAGFVTEIIGAECSHENNTLIFCGDEQRKVALPDDMEMPNENGMNAALAAISVAKRECALFFAAEGADEAWKYLKIAKVFSAVMILVAIIFTVSDLYDFYRADEESENLRKEKMLRVGEFSVYDSAKVKEDEIRQRLGALSEISSRNVSLYGALVHFGFLTGEGVYLTEFRMDKANSVKVAGRAESYELLSEFIEGAEKDTAIFKKGATIVESKTDEAGGITFVVDIPLRYSNEGEK